MLFPYAARARIQRDEDNETGKKTTKEILKRWI